jgi:hypothetical protein
MPSLIPPSLSSARNDRSRGTAWASADAIIPECGSAGPWHVQLGAPPPKLTRAPAVESSGITGVKLSRDAAVRRQSPKGATRATTMSTLSRTRCGGSPPTHAHPPSSFHPPTPSTVVGTPNTPHSTQRRGDTVLTRRLPAMAVGPPRHQGQLALAMAARIDDAADGM